ncbi:MAG TPA: hypothetical protein VII92_20620 [Anaerolineae bacterium]
MNSRTLHLTLIILGAIVQAIAAFEVPAIAPFRAGLLGLAGTLLLLGKASRAFGRGEAVTVKVEDTQP